MNKPYQFKSRTRAKKVDVKKTGFKYEVKEAEEVLPLTIQGREPGSTQEARVSVALSMLGIKYRYQYVIAGGSSLRGGQTIDFVAYTAPLPTLIYVQGSYWHQDKVKNKFNQQKALKVFGGNAYVKEFWEEELMSIDMAFQTARRELYGR